MTESMPCPKARLYFISGGDAYAIPAENAVRVMRVERERISPLPFVEQEGVMGVFNHNGSVVAIASIPGLYRQEYDGQAVLTLLLITCEKGLFAIPVDGVLGMADAADAQKSARLLNARSLYEGKLG